MTGGCRRRGVRPHALTLVEMVIAVVLVGAVIAAAAVGTSAVTSRADTQLADTALDRVVHAQASQAMARGGYVWGQDGDDADLQARLPAGLTRDLDVVHGRSTAADQVSVAVGSAGTLVVAVALDDGECRYRRVTAPADGGDQQQATTTARCAAAGLLPAGETPAWD